MKNSIQTRRQFLKALGLTAAGISIHGCGESLETRSSKLTKDKPNIIFILTDDQRWDEMSCMGHKFLKTPNMDRIRNEGVLFANAFCTTSLCSPSRATFLTGTYAHRHGHYTDLSGASSKGRLYNRTYRQAAHGSSR